MKKFVSKRKRSRNPGGKVGIAYPLPPRDTPYEKRGTINVINGGFDSGGKSCGDREVYVANILRDITLVKWP